jgi:glycosyltransferase involved in cell wall biosynthesis
VAQRAVDGFPSVLATLRVLIVHEWLYTWAGAERCLEQMMQVVPHADLLVGMISPEMRGYNDLTRGARESWAGRIPGARTKHRWFLPLHAAAFATFDTSGYDLIISSSHAVEKFVRKPNGAKHVCYCYTPPRYFWDMQQLHSEMASPMARAALAVSAPLWRVLDKRAARGVDRFVAISNHVAARIERSYGRPADVVYPPVARKPESPSRTRKASPYLLSLGRLVEYKRVDLAIRAAEKVGMNLVVAGDGPDRERLERLGGKNATFVGAVSEEQAGDLLAGCAAFVFAGEEDFGISLVEANGHGRPVVCLGRGGAAETMIHGETAIMFQTQGLDSIADAITTCLATTWDAERLRANAARFSPEQFRKRFMGVLLAAVA